MSNRVDLELLYSEDPKLFTRPKIREIKRGNEIFCLYRSFAPDFSDRNSVLRWGESTASQAMQIRLRPYTDNEDEIRCVDFDEDYSVFQTKSNKYITKFHVPAYFYPAIVGSKGKTRDRIEKETLVNIKIPKHGETGEIIITGATEHSVISARTRINMIIIRKRDQHPVTHFLSIPIISDTIKENFEKFKQNVLKGPPMRGIDETIFQKPNKLHLTLITLVLFDQIEIDNALSVFYYTKDNIIDPALEKIGNIRLKVQGVEIMNDDPTEVDVLYGKTEPVDPEHKQKFQKLVDDIADYFTRKGLTRKQRDSIKLHVTLMNSSFRSRNSDDESGENVYKKRETFDASNIMNDYDNFHFGEVDVESLHFSIRFTTGEDLYYKPVSTVPLKIS